MESKDIVILRIDPLDWPLLKAIRLRALGDTPDAFGTLLADEENQADDFWKDRASNDKVGTFIAVGKDTLSAYAAAGERRLEDCAGLITGAPCFHRMGHAAGEGAAGLYSMWVAPVARRRNVGKSLVEEVKKWARKEGTYTKLLLIVADYNLPAIRLYESCGFALSGTHFDYGDRIPEKEYCYQL